MKNALINGDSLDILKKFPDNSFDSMITDPPAGIAFMGKNGTKIRVVATSGLLG